MLLVAGLVAALAGLQAVTPQDIPVLKANLGDCSADFVVRGADGHPVYNATIHVRVRYGFMSLKRIGRRHSTRWSVPTGCCWRLPCSVMAGAGP